MEHFIQRRNKWLKFDFKSIWMLLFVTLSFIQANAQTMIPMPGYASTYPGNSRGMWFQAPVGFYLQV
jgi:hypothetical protein